MIMKKNFIKKQILNSLNVSRLILLSIIMQAFILTSCSSLNKIDASGASNNNKTDGVSLSQSSDSDSVNNVDSSDTTSINNKSLNDSSPSGNPESSGNSDSSGSLDTSNSNDSDTESKTILSADPALVEGVLPNGMRYFLFKNATPKDRVSMHLNVQSGSMHERDDQQGVAHFLEHMLFNGSTHFKPGELIEYFQSIGMMFGADANARTGFFETVYDIFLPAGDKANLEKGLLVLQDYAEGALLLDSEVERERGVIIAEMRERDSVALRTFKASLEFELPGSLIARRLPIGDQKVIESADRTLLKDFYDTWYRPDNMAIVMVGDFDIDMAVNLINERFSAIQPRSSAAELPVNTWESHAPEEVFYHYEQEAGKTDVSIGTVTWVDSESENLNIFKDRVLKRIADTIVQNRLSKDLRKEDSPFSNAGIYSGLFLQNIYFTAISAQCSLDKWKETLGFIEKSLRRALEHGFTEPELDRVKADFLLGLETAVKEASTRESSTLAKEIISSINRNRVFLSPEQEREVLKSFIENLTVDDVTRAFRENWSAQHRLIEVTGNAEIKSKNTTPEAYILSAYHESQKNDVAQVESNDEVIFPYLPTPSDTDNIASDKEVKSVGIRVVEFKNGVRVNIKKTDFKKGEFIYRLDFGAGKKSEPWKKPGLAFLTQGIINESGVGKLTRDELETSLAGKNINFTFSADTDSFIYSGSASPSETSLLFQLLYTLIMDPGFDAESLVLFKNRYRQMFQELLSTPDGMMQFKGEAFLAGGDTRFGMPTLEQMESLTMKDVKKWITPFFKQGDIEISVVGDLDIDEVIRLASKYFGNLERKGSLTPKGSSGVIVEDKRDIIVFPESKKIELQIDSKIDKALVVMAFPTDDFWKIKQTRRLNILSKILSERLRKTVREELGATYSPYAYNDSSQSYKGYGVLRAVINVTPDKVDDMLSHIESIADSMTTEKITDKELDLVLEPIWTYIKDIRRTNGYWLDSVMAGSLQHPEKIEWAATMDEDYRSVSLDEIHYLAEKFCNRKQAAFIVIQPLGASQ
ncbi:MAG: insulinase family protein [Desulfamplus sp.]|nr:insulinase family protein [Desulfamplus sp.]